MHIDLIDIAKSFGANVKYLDHNFFNTVNFAYEDIDGSEERQLILDILKKIDSDRQVIGALERTKIWNDGWSENLSDFRDNPDLSCTIPKFIRPNQLIRFNQKYIRPANPNFEADYFKMFQLWFFGEYLYPFDHIHEFGCGSGINLAAIAKMFPHKNLTGYDFAPSAVELINTIGSHYEFKMQALFFDMLKPDYSCKIQKNSCVLTIGTMEQLASNFYPFMDYLLDQRPGLCLHVEPTIELYDENNLIDYLAIKFLKKRGYTVGLLPYLQELHKAGRIELIKVKRLFFGSLYQEGYNYMVWKPL